MTVKHIVGTHGISIRYTSFNVSDRNLVGSDDELNNILSYNCRLLNLNIL